VRRGGALVVAAALVGGGCWAYAAHAGGPSGYRTASAARASVTATLSLTGTIKPLGRSDLQFATSGTVASVAEVGTRVRKGAVVARLQTSALQQAVFEALAHLATAQAQLARDTPTRDEQVAASASAAAASSSAAAEASRAAQQGGSQQAGDPVTAAQQACLASGGTSGTGGSGHQGGTGMPTGGATAPGGGTPSSAPSTAARSSSGKAPSPGKGGTSTRGSSEGKGSTLTCAQALARLATYVQSLSKQADVSRQSGGQGSGAQSTQSGLGTGGATVTAATLSKDQADIDSARSDLAGAQAELAGAVLKAPAAGTVAEVDVSRGGSASSGSVAVTILGKGITTVTVEATSTQVAKLKAGQRASVLPAGAVSALPATVTRIGEVPSTDSGTSTYPVTLTLAATDLSLMAGASAAVDVTVGTATDALTVPTSAVSEGTVTVLSGGSTSRVRVTTGVVGPTRTQITAGLSDGATVVLADLGAAVPSSGTQQTVRGFGGGGGTFTGGGLGAGGGGFGGGGLDARH